MTRVALITLHYKNLTDTIGLLQSIKEAKQPKDFELFIYIVDNESSPDLDHVVETDYPNAQIIKSGRNAGFAAGNNLGFQRALENNVDIIIAINNDVYIDKDFFAKVLTSPINEANVGAVGGLIYFAPGYEFKSGYAEKDKGKVIWYAGGSFDWNNVLGANTHVDEVDHGQFKKSFGTQFVTGALLITKPEVLKKVGLFDEKYFMYLEDVDLCHRITLSGYRLVVDPEIKIWHKVAQGSAIGSNLNDYFITRNRLYFGLKFARSRTKFALFREAMKKMVTGTPAQKTAILDFFTGRLSSGSFIKS